MTRRPTEAELLAAAKAGDASALEALLRSHEAQVYRFGVRVCRSEEDAKDVLQETLVAAFRGVHAFRGEAALSTWLFQVARTHCARMRRKRVGGPEAAAPLDSAEAAAVQSETPAPDETSHAREMAEALRTALLALSDTDREAVLLRDLEGLSAQEAAQIAGIEVRALKSRLHRARQRLRGELAGLKRDGDS